MAVGNHYTEAAVRRPVPRCPTCGNQASETQTRYGLRNECCGLRSWDRYPLVSEETHTNRKAAHAAFDRLWKSGLVKRGHAYKLLAKAMRLSKEDCHIKFMDAETAARVPLIAMTIERRLNDEKEMLK